MNRFISIVMILCSVNIGCHSPSDEISTAFKTVDNSLQKSSANIDSANATLLKSLQDKLSCSITEEANALSIYIQSIKNELEEYSAKKYPSKEGAPPTFQDLESSNTIMIEKGKASFLFLKLNEFNQLVLNCDISKDNKAVIEKIFAPDFFKNSKTFNNQYFKNTPTVAALTMLSSFQNKIKNIQNILLTAIVQPLENSTQKK